ncbi:MAG: N-acetyltransferase [Peptococcaceae bacterium]|nr:N-acetyltransferase [Peptococcaceae bacterium]
MIKYRKANLLDSEDIVRLIADYAAEGLMLPRSRNSVYEGIWEYSLALDGDVVVGVGGLHVVWQDLAEVRSLAVDRAYTGRGVGSRLVGLLVEEARQLCCQRVFALTYQVGFFEKLGFYLANKEDMPHKVWKECLNCVKFPNCDETALIMDLIDS